MKPVIAFAAFFLPAVLAAAPTGFVITVDGVPAGTSEIVAVIDIATAATSNYDDPPPAPAAAQPAAAAPAAAPGAQPSLANAALAAAAPAPAPAAGQGRRGRRGGQGGGQAAAAAAPTRVTAMANGATSVTLNAEVAVGDRYQIRVVALKGTDAMPVVLAGGRIAPAKAEADKLAPVHVTLAAPTLKLAPANPSSVAPGASYTLAGVVTDAANSLGTKNRMRVWISSGQPPRENYAGTQISTVDTKTEGNDVTFSFMLTAPKEPATLYFQFGELPSDFARADGKQAPFLVLPDVKSGVSPFQLQVAPAKLAIQ